MRLPLTQPRIVQTIVLISLSYTPIHMTTQFVNGASTSSPQCTLPSQQQTSKRNIPNDRSLIALNVVPQYIDDDFTIPSINNLIRSGQRYHHHPQPPIMQRFLQRVVPTFHPTRYFTSSSETSLSSTTPVANFVIVGYIVSSFARVVIQKLLQLSGRRPKDVVGPNDANTVDPTMIVATEDWKDMYDHIHLEVKNLRQQILDLTEKLEQEQNQKLEAIKVELKEKEEKELNDSIQYWKDMVQKKDEEMNTKLQMERQKNLQQLEQLKNRMTQVVDEERRNMYTEFTSMVQQLRENLNLVPVSSATD